MSRTKLFIFMFLIFTLTFIAIASLFVNLDLNSNSSNKIELSRSINSEVINKMEDKRLLLYFGYIDLEKSLNILDSLDKIGKTLFINLSQTQSKIDSKNIVELKLDTKELEEIAREFQVYIDKPILKGTIESHTPFIYLIEKESGRFKIKYIYKDLILDDILKDFNS